MPARPTTARASLTAAARSVFIFQLPAISLRRMGQSRGLKVECREPERLPKYRTDVEPPKTLWLWTFDSRPSTNLPHRLHLCIGAENFEAQRFLCQRINRSSRSRL